MNLEKEKDDDFDFNKLKAQKFSTVLREKTLNIARDIRGMALRIAAYTAEYSFLSVFNGNPDTTPIIPLVITSATMFAGEFFLWDRVVKKFPWFRISFCEDDQN